MQEATVNAKPIAGFERQGLNTESEKYMTYSTVPKQLISYNSRSILFWMFSLLSETEAERRDTRRNEEGRAADGTW